MKINSIGEHGNNNDKKHNLLDFVCVCVWGGGGGGWEGGGREDVCQIILREHVLTPWEGLVVICLKISVAL